MTENLKQDLDKADPFLCGPRKEFVTPKMRGVLFFLFFSCGYWNIWGNTASPAYMQPYQLKSAARWLDPWQQQQEQWQLSGDN